jgi:SAM-dependent methyltransferase
MNGLSSESERKEEGRIRAAYGKRQGDDARYSWFSPGHLYIVQERERRVLTLLRRNGFAPLSTKTILEIGCGTGYWLRDLIKWGARPENITGLDLLPDRVVEARELCPGAVRIQCGSAAKLALPNEAFDLVFQSTVFTSILDRRMRRQVASEMLRVVKGDGLIIWYDFHVNNPWNSNVRGIDRREICQLFPGCRIELRRITLAPPLLRLLAPYSWLASYAFGKIPWLCTHYLGAIRKA